MRPLPTGELPLPWPSPRGEGPTVATLAAVSVAVERTSQAGVETTPLHNKEASEFTDLHHWGEEPLLFVHLLKRVRWSCGPHCRRCGRVECISESLTDLLEKNCPCDCYKVRHFSECRSVAKYLSHENRSVCKGGATCRIHTKRWAVICLRVLLSEDAQLRLARLNLLIMERLAPACRKGAD